MNQIQIEQRDTVIEQLKQQRKKQRVEAEQEIEKLKRKYRQNELEVQAL